MSSSTLYERLFLNEDRGILVLLDPDKIERDKVASYMERLNSKDSIKAILVGTTVMFSLDFDEFVGMIKAHSKMPVIIFPGNSLQISAKADGILFLSLVSGKNPEFLIGEQVKMAPMIKKLGLEAIPTAYMLVESGNLTSVEYVSQTKPIPRNKPDVARAIAMASELLGFKLIYLEAGSGARMPVPQSIIEAVRESVDIPILVGGGIRRREDIDRAFDAGATHVVIGTAIEERIEVIEEL